MKKNATIIGITGGIGSGKSTVARMLGDMGAEVIDADEMCRELLAKPTMVRRLKAEFGQEITSEDGELKPSAIADIVFADGKALAKLNALLHPPVRRQVRRAAAGVKRSGGVLVIDAALLMENGLDEICDLIVFIHAPAKIRVARTKLERGWKAGEIKRREKFQLPVKEKKQKADYVINSAGSRRQTLTQVKSLWRGLSKE